MNQTARRQVGGGLAGLYRRSLPRQLVLFAAGMGGVELLDRVVLPHSVPAGEIAYGSILGIVYALLAVGLILVYQSNRIINFAVAEFGVFGAILYQNLQGQARVPWILAVITGVAGAAGMGFVMERLLARRFAESSRLILTVVTIGMAQFAAFAEIEVSKHFGTMPASAGLRTPLSSIRFAFGGVTFDGNAILLVAMAIAILVSLEFFLHRTDYGIAIRAAAENGPRASLLGVPVKTASTIAWVVAALVAGIATILEAPMTGVVAGGTVVGPTLLYKALTVAVIADFTDLRVCVLAGVFLGSLEQSIAYSYSGSTITDAIFIAITIVVLLLRRQHLGRIAETTASSWRSIREIRRIPPGASRKTRVLAVRGGAAAVAGLLLVVGPMGLSGTNRFDAAEIIVFALVAISCVVVTGWSGQISLGQFALAAVGAVTSGKLFAQAHWDFFASLIAGGVMGSVISMLLGAVATRVRGFLFAVTSLGFAIALESYFLNPRFFSPLIPIQGFINLNRPVLFGRINLGGDLAYYYFCLAILILVGLAVSTLRKSRTGRALIAVKDNDRAARAFGVSRVGSLLASFAISGFIAGIAGCLFAFHAGSVTPGDYAASQSVTVFAMAVIGGLGSVPSAVIGAAVIEGWGFTFAQNQALDALGTAAGLTIVLLFIPEGIGSVVYRIRDIALGPFSPDRFAGGKDTPGSSSVPAVASGISGVTMAPMSSSVPAVASGISGVTMAPMSSSVPAVASGINPGDPRLASAPPPPTTGVPPPPFGVPGTNLNPVLGNPESR